MENGRDRSGSETITYESPDQSLLGKGGCNNFPVISG